MINVIFTPFTAVVFLVFTLLAFIVVVGYLDLIKYIIAPDYWSGLKVVPIVMVAEIMMGVYFNLSFWYKLIDKTMWGAVFSGVGCAVLCTPSWYSGRTVIVLSRIAT